MRSFWIFAWAVVLAGDWNSDVSAQVAFVDVTASSGLNFVGHIPMPPASPVGPSTWAGCGAAVADYNGDGHLDVYLLDAFGWPNQLYRNNGDRTFTNVTSQSGLGHTGSSRVALMYDFDNDGDPDVVLANETQGYAGLISSQIFRNDGGAFINVTAGSGFNPNSIILGGMAASDYDDDGLLDIYVTTWNVVPGTPKNYLYRNLGELRFEDVTQQLGLHVPATGVQAWTPVFVDLDGDGDQDLFTAVDFETNYYFRLDRNDGAAPAFVNQSFQANVFHCCSDTSGNDMGVAVGDMDGDGDLDIFTTNITLPPPNQMLRTNLLLVNNGLPAPFTDEAVARGVWNSYWGWGTAFFDADLDGDLDLYSVNGRSAGDGGYWSDRPAQLFLNDGAGAHPNGSGYFTESAVQAGVAHTGNGRAFIPFDYDNDGDLDLLITNVAQPVVLFENVTPRINHWLGLRLVGTTRNRDAVGAKVNVTVGSTTQMREIIAGGSSYATPPLEAHFGLASATLAEQVVINWPGGATTTWYNIPADQRLTIVEGAPSPSPALISMTVEGPTTVTAGNSASYHASGSYHYAASGDVTTLASWSVSPATNAQISATGVLTTTLGAAGQSITVTARLGERSASRVVSVVSAGAPIATAPVLTITQPTSLDTFTTSTSEITLSGTIMASGAFASVGWASDSGGSGSCRWTESTWECGPLALAMGYNRFTVTTVDDVSQSGSDVIQVHRVPSTNGRVIAMPLRLEFGREFDELDLTLSLEGLASIGYKIVPDAAWLVVDPESGALYAASSPTAHRVSVVRSILTADVEYAGSVAIETNNAAVGTILVEARATGRSSSVSAPGVDGPPDPVTPNEEDPGDGGDVTGDLPSEPGVGSPTVDEPAQQGSRPRACGAMGAIWPLAFSLLALFARRRPLGRAKA